MVKIQFLIGIVHFFLAFIMPALSSLSKLILLGKTTFVFVRVLN